MASSTTKMYDFDVQPIGLILGQRHAWLAIADHMAVAKWSPAYTPETIAHIKRRASLPVAWYDDHGADIEVIVSLTEPQMHAVQRAATEILPFRCNVVRTNKGGHSEDWIRMAEIATIAGECAVRIEAYAETRQIVKKLNEDAGEDYVVSVIPARGG